MPGEAAPPDEATAVPITTRPAGTEKWIRYGGARSQSITSSEQQRPMRTR